MARIRTIKPDFWTDEKIVELSFEARLFFIGSWNFADDNGNVQRSARKLKMQIFPADPIDCEPIIQTLMNHGMLIEYSVNGEDYLHIKGFKAHQVINRPSKSGLPEPESSQLIKPLTECSLTEGKGKEGKGREEKKEREKTTAAAKPKKQPRVDQTLTAWLESLPEGEMGIPEDDPVFASATRSGLPDEFVVLEWHWFKRKFGSSSTKRYKDWRQVFRNAVAGVWGDLWRSVDSGGYVLTTAGQQLQRSLGDAE